MKQEKSDSGIVPPETARGRPQTARITAVGGFDDGSANEGDLVVFAGYSGTGISPDDEDPLILDADDLLGLVEA